MECRHLKLLVIFLVTTWTGCSGVHFNATAFTNVPPLYALDEWSKCQHPEDVYCIADAVLVSSTPSPLLDFIQEYSSDIQRHYNRTLLHRGVCVTRCGGRGPETWRDAAESCINQSLVEYGLEAQVLSVKWCNKPDVKLNTTAHVFNVVHVLLLLLVFLATGLDVFGKICGRCEGNKYLLAFSIKKNWKSLTLVRSDSKADGTADLSCIEGIRFFGTLCVISTHVTVSYVYSFIDNPEFIENMLEHIPTQTIFNTPIWIQVFFSISGFLTTYFTLVYAKNHSLTFGKCILSLLNRFIRLTPVAMSAMWFIIAFPRLNSGPQWTYLVERESVECTERWWYHLIYVHNYLPMGKYCLGHTWYLAADMQLHIVGTFLLLIILRWRKTLVPIVTVLLSGSILASGLVAYIYDVHPIITAQTPEITRNMFSGSEILPKLYLPAWMNLSGYVFGLSTAFIFYNNLEKGAKLNENKWFNFLYHASLGLAFCVTLAGVAFLADVTPPRWASILYSCFDKVLVAFFFNIFMLGCFSNCKSVIREMLCWHGFHVLGRLSYIVFIIHFIVMRVTIASNTQIGHVSAYSMMSLLIVGTVLSFIIAIPIYLIIEMPFVQLYKALLGGRTEKKEENEQNLASAPTKLDVVREIRKRNGTNEV